jgi:NhaP-type Na+/H+ or K+/H+ antiporter
VSRRTAIGLAYLALGVFGIIVSTVRDYPSMQAADRWVMLPWDLMTRIFASCVFIGIALMIRHRSLVETTIPGIVRLAVLACAVTFAGDMLVTAIGWPLNSNAAELARMGISAVGAFGLIAMFSISRSKA